MQNFTKTVRTGRYDNYKLERCKLSNSKQNQTSGTSAPTNKLRSSL